MRVCVARRSLLGTTSVALIYLHGIAAAQQPPSSTDGPSASPAAQSQPSATPDASNARPSAVPGPSDSPSSATATPPSPPATSSPAQANAPAEVDLPQVTVEGRQPRPARRTTSNEPTSRPTASRATPAPAAPPAVAIRPSALRAIGTDRRADSDEYKPELRKSISSPHPERPRPVFRHSPRAPFCAACPTPRSGSRKTASAASTSPTSRRITAFHSIRWHCRRRRSFAGRAPCASALRP